MDHSERNRQHAKRSRQRKREFLNTLEQSVREIKAENQRLFDILGVNASDATTAMVNKEENKKAESIERFMDALKQPQNRVLDDTALASLRELFH